MGADALIVAVAAYATACTALLLLYFYIQRRHR